MRRVGDAARHSLRSLSADPPNPPPPAQPLSLEELLKKREAEREAQARPVFRTKEQRQQEALARRAEEAAEARARAARIREGLLAPRADEEQSRGRPAQEALSLQEVGAPTHGRPDWLRDWHGAGLAPFGLCTPGSLRLETAAAPTHPPSGAG